MTAGPSPRGDRAPVHIDLTEASLEQYDAVLEHLRRNAHYHELDGSILTVQERHADGVRAVLARASGAQAHTIPGYLPGRISLTNWSRQHVNRRIAPRLARLVGALVDGAVGGLVFWLGAEGGRVGQVAAPVAISVVFVAMTGLLGATPGKLVVRTCVEGPDGGRPGVPRALVRWAVAVLPSGAAVVLAAVSEGAAVASVSIGTLAVFVGVLAHPEARGLHDMAAGTTVVRRGS